MVIVFAIPSEILTTKKAVDNYNYNDLKGYSETKEPHTKAMNTKCIWMYTKGISTKLVDSLILPKPTDKEEIKKTKRLQRPNYQIYFIKQGRMA